MASLSLSFSSVLFRSTVSPNPTKSGVSPPQSLNPRSLHRRRRSYAAPPSRAVETASPVEVGVGDDFPDDYGSRFPSKNPEERRRAGVVLHPTSLRGPHGIGDLGEEALRFDFVHPLSCLQVLPLVPPGRKSNEDGSPYAGQIDIFIAQQFLFQRQWQKVRDYAQKKGIRIMGDMPIYVGYHSADVWANKRLFMLDRTGFPFLVSGVPPDAFSETGQLWGSPLYDWKAMEDDGFSWWIQRIQRAYNLYDECRIDHFRGLAGFWAVPSESKIATFGKWKAGPKKALFDAIFKAVGKINIVAEDLGVITEDVVQLRKDINAPGMAVLQFAFGSRSDNPHLPHNHEPNQVVYTGTHDNDTIVGWWENLEFKEKSNVLKYLGISKDDDISWALIQFALSSVARTAIMPMQDILGLGNSARMNTPATQLGNWRWRIPNTTTFDDLEAESSKLQDLVSMYNRL
ncbi:hypothetical protein QJS10_CPA09g00458 [Acorus calamus]|uniref:4-alpha-glucanotransferase n=1 Tax=Acorus calamus TaxID=4465 RepID=A0AAV9E6T6_ACOCL|nr:hypothetical protein QJS10_CPA09g00458 [Acorus calamus]